MLPTAKKFYFVLGFAFLCVTYLGSRLLSGRHERELSVNVTGPTEEVHYGVGDTPASLLENFDFQNEEIARRIGEETENYPRKDFIYETGFWNYVKNFFYNRWLTWKESKKQIDDGTAEELSQSGIDVKLALKEPNIIRKTYDKIDEKFDEVKKDAKEAIKGGIRDVLEKTVEVVTRHKKDNSDDESCEEMDSTWTNPSEVSLEEPVQEGVPTVEPLENLDTENIRLIGPHEKLAEIEKTLKEFQEIAKNSKLTNVKELMEDTLDKKFGELKEGAKDLIKDGIHKLIGANRADEEALEIKDDLAKVRQAWEDTKKKLDKEFEYIQDSAKNLMAEKLIPEVKSGVDQTEAKAEIAKAIEEEVNKATKTPKGFADNAKIKIDGKIDEIKEKAKGAIKSGVKRLIEGTKDTITSFFSSHSEDSSHEDHDTSLDEYHSETGVESGLSNEFTHKKSSGKKKSENYDMKDEYAML